MSTPTSPTTKKHTAVVTMATPHTITKATGQSGPTTATTAKVGGRADLGMLREERHNRLLAGNNAHLNAGLRRGSKEVFRRARRSSLSLLHVQTTPT